MTTLFISHSSKDTAWAERVHQALFDGGYQCLFLDCHPDDGIHAGADWERTLYQRLRQSRGVIVLCSANWLASPWCVAEAMMARERKKRVFLLATADVLDDRQVKGVEDAKLQIPDFLKDRQFISLAGGSEKVVYQQLLQGLEKEGLNKHDFKLPERPYPGLEPFQETDAAVFFGRDDESDQIIDVLHKRRKGDANGFVVVLGASGCGKSSLVRAGVLPQLKHASKDDDAPAAWVVVAPFLSGKGLEGLALSLARAFKDAGQPRELATVRGRLATASDVRALGSELLLAHSAPDGCVLLVLDQLEEVFGTPEASEARAALGLLLDASADTSGSVVILATLRSDFLNAFQLFEGAAKRYEEVTLDPMLRSHFSEVIEGPADRFGLDLDAGLSERMVEETAYNDALPLLAFTLEKLYEKCKSQGRLTLKAYGELGGVSAAIQHAADEILEEAGYAGLPADDPRMRDLRRAFCNLAQVGEEGQFAKRIARWSRMPVSCEAILKRFVGQRLLVSETANGEPVLSVAHEALFRVWETLGDWLSQDREFLRTRERIAARARLWKNEKRSNDRLLPPGRPLAEGEDVLANRRADLEPLLIEYIEASAAAVRANERRRRRRTRAFMVAMAVVTLLALGSGSVAWWQRIEADHQRQRVTAQNLATQAALLAERGPDADTIERAAALAVESWRRMENSQAIETASELVKMLPAVAIEGGEKDKFVSTSDGRYLATGDADGVLRLFAAENGKEIANVKQGAAIHDIIFSPDGRWLTTRNAELLPRASTGGTMRVIEVASGREVASAEHRGKTWEKQFSRDGRFLATFGGEEGAVQLYELVGEREIALQLDGEITDCAFSPDGRVLATAGKDGTARLIDTANGREIARIQHDGPITKAQFSSDGRFFATLERDSGSVRMFDGVSDRQIDRIAPDEKISTFSFSRDSRTLATGGIGGTVSFIDVATRKEVGRIAHTAKINTVGFRPPDGRWFAVFSDDGLVRFFEGSTTKEVARIEYRSLLPWFRYNYDVSRFFMSNYDGLGRLIDVASGREIARMDHGTYISAAGFSFDNRLLVTGSEDGVVRLFDAENGEEIGKIDHGGSITIAVDAIVFSFDNRLIAAASETGSVGIIDRGSLREIRRFTFDGPVSGVHLSPDGRFVVADSKKIPSFMPLESEGKTTRLFSVPDGREVLRLKNRLPEFSHGVGVEIASSDDRRLAFSSDSRLLTTASGKNVSVVDAASHKEITRSVVPDGLIDKIVFSPNGRWVAALVFSGRSANSTKSVRDVRLIDVETGRESGRVEVKDPVSFVFSEDSHFLAVSDQTRVALYDTISRSIVAYVQHEKEIKVVVFSQDGDILATGDEGGTVLLTKTQNGQQAVPPQLSETRESMHPQRILHSAPMERRSSSPTATRRHWLTWRAARRRAILSIQKERILLPSVLLAANSGGSRTPIWMVR